MPGKGTISKANKNIHLNLGILKKGGERFEISVDPDKAIAFKRGEEKDMTNVLMAEKIFSNAKEGTLASEELMEELFNTADPIKVAEMIINNGEIQLTSEYRKRKQEEKRKMIVMMISRNAVNPTNKLPHPPGRIEDAMSEAKVKIDDFKKAEEQVERIIQELQPVIPIKIEVDLIEIKIPGEYAPKTYSSLKSFGKIISENWLSDGSWFGKVEIPGGMKEEFFDKLNSLTKGNNETRIIDR